MSCACMDALVHKAPLIAWLACCHVSVNCWQLRTHVTAWLLSSQSLLVPKVVKYRSTACNVQRRSARPSAGAFWAWGYVKAWQNKTETATPTVCFHSCVFLSSESWPSRSCDVTTDSIHWHSTVVSWAFPHPPGQHWSLGSAAPTQVRVKLRCHIYIFK